MTEQPFKGELCKKKKKWKYFLVTLRKVYKIFIFKHIACACRKWKNTNWTYDTYWVCKIYQLLLSKSYIQILHSIRLTCFLRVWRKIVSFLGCRYETEGQATPSVKIFLIWLLLIFVVNHNTFLTCSSI